jgi:DNA (cytosine-5)-methyltransferase 1
MIGMTVCSGIGAPEVSAPWIDWRYQSEIEPFPCAVLAHRFPHAVNLGDMTRFKEWPDATVDVLCGGTPCQSFSVAGLRKGLDDPRGNLMLTYLAIADRYRPRWIVWENVPGVLSSNGGRDFGAFLGAMGQLGYGFAYRVLDAQYTRTREFSRAVPQRRRRVFVVGYLGDWRRAAAVLFDGESLRGDPPPRRTAGQVAPTVPSRSSAGGGLGTDFDCDGGLIPQVSLCLNAGGMGRIDGESGTFVPVANALRGEGFDASEDGTGRGTPLVPIAFDTTQITSAANYSSPKPGDPCHPLAAGAHPPAIATPWAVRRLTPTECERLMGFPDGWTRIPYRGKAADACPDGPRYKALGNSWAVNCGQLVFDRLRMVEETWP